MAGFYSGANGTAPPLHWPTFAPVVTRGSVTVKLQPQPDAYGFIYGHAWRGERMVSLNVMPPESHWRGQYKLEDHKPSKAEWVFFIEGREVARISGQPDLESEFKRLLLAP